MQSINKHYILVGGEGEKGREIPKGHISGLFHVCNSCLVFCFIFFKQGVHACLNTLFCEIFSFKKKKKILSKHLAYKSNNLLAFFTIAK